MVKRSSTSDTGGKVHKAAVTLGHRGGLKGGPARSIHLSKQERSEIAKKGGIAKARKRG